MKKILFFLSIVSILTFSGCKKNTVSVDNNAEKEAEKSDTYVPWWVTNPQK